MPKLVIQHSDPHLSHVTEGADGHMTVRPYIDAVHAPGCGATRRWPRWVALAERTYRAPGDIRAIFETTEEEAEDVMAVNAGDAWNDKRAAYVGKPYLARTPPTVFS